MRLQRRSYSKVKLLDLLSRRKKSLKDFLQEMGIVTFESLKIRCNGMGVHPPTEQEFLDAMGNPILPELSSPTEGVIVIQPKEDLQLSRIKIPSNSEQTEEKTSTKKKK